MAPIQILGSCRSPLSTAAAAHRQRHVAARLLSRGLANLAMFNAAKKFARSADPSDRKRLAIVDDSGAYTYERLLKDARKVRSALGNKDHKGASVAMLMPNSYEYAAVQWGIWASGGAAVPLSPMHPDRELEYFITNSGSSQVICHPSLRNNLQPVIDKLGGTVRVLESNAILDMPDTSVEEDVSIDENQNALFIYTSGTTGKPKGVVHTHANIAAQVSALHEAWGWTSSDRLLHMLPLHHVHGIVVALCSALWSGATTEMIPKFDKDRVWSRVIDGPQDISILMGVPTMYARLLQALEGMPGERQSLARKAMGNLRLTISGSAALPTSVFRRWQDATGQVMLERYGMSEIGMALSNDGLDPKARKAGSVGKPLPGVGVRLVDSDGKDVSQKPGASGMIQVKGPNVFSEYYGLPEKTAKEFTPDGWFITGDIGTRDADGLYYIMGRQSVDIIKSGGFKLSALEIERELLEHPAIADVAVVGIPSEEWGEVVAAAVTLKPGASLTIEELKPWCHERMAHYKAPKMLRAASELPRNLMGKLDKKAVKALFS
ncbi:AMP-dependent synthetase and ligase [Martensiomyces pterosporus]|nr:AMP-dependent synthetase and ligase [Martensiomyces pterosporus]